MQKKTVAIVAIIVVVGLALTGRHPPHRARRARRRPRREAAGRRSSIPRGPHGARLLSDDGLQVEMTIYETGVPPQFRVYPYDAALKPIPPREVDLVVELHRLGGRVDRITFTPEADYLRGDAVVEEPHSFDVKVVGDAGRPAARVVVLADRRQGAARARPGQERRHRHQHRRAARDADDARAARRGEGGRDARGPRRAAPAGRRDRGAQEGGRPRPARAR